MQPVPAAFERARLKQGADELLEEEGIAFGALEDPLLQIGRECARAHEADEKLAVRIAVQRRELELGGAIGGRAEGGRAQRVQVDALVGAAGQHDQQGRLGGEGQEVLQERNGGAVQPVHVVERHHDRSLAAAPLEQLAHRVEGASLDDARVGARLGELAGLEDRCECGGVLAGDRPFPRPAGQEPPEGEVGKCRSIRHPPAVEPQDTRGGGVAPKLAQQPALADARLADHHEHAARAGNRPNEPVAGEVQLPASAHEARLRHRRGRHVGGRPPLDRLERPDRGSLALQLKVPALAPAKERLHQLAAPGPHQHRPRVGRPLQAGRGVERIARRREPGLPARIDRRDHRQAGLDAHTDRRRLDRVAGSLRRRVRADVGDDAQTGEHRSLGVVLVRDRGSEQRQQTVAGKVLDRASEAVDGGDHAAHRRLHERAEVLGVHPLAERGRPDHVGEQRGDHTASLCCRSGRERCAAAGAEARVGRRWRPAGCAPCGRRFHAPILRAFGNNFRPDVLASPCRWGHRRQSGS